MSDAPTKKASAGAPAWVLTFADLMSLLLAFFVLLFSFSEMDKQKFKELSGSMRDAFGVQREVPAFSPPIGTSIIARDFSPGQPKPTIENQVRQEAAIDMRSFAEVPLNEEMAITEEDLAEDLEKVKEHLAVEIQEGLVEVDDDGERVITIRIRETGSFPSGSADMDRDFLPVINKIAVLVEDIGGHVVIAGHTDKLPIYNQRFHSNWELSAARAATVLERIVEVSGRSASYFRLAGHADTRPIDTNDTAEGRARNRRVEVILLRGSIDDAATGPAIRGREASVMD
ncbi:MULTISPECIES: flagellar motor protein MotB [Spongiibacter]|uniref:flagellar motor protein MotB n=2 Tax=Spongiibacteraceae TaxID=1706375 RepID=UPI0003B300E9|nr:MULTISPECIES: flagellar motor protein MotB [Spongiibacter]